MRVSCNGCRVLRKGCSDDCAIRPCLDWIKCPESQANATLFLAKFYGRAGLMNLIAAGPDHLRPAIFRSLLYEACGRIVSPINGSVGLLLSGKWALCQDAVESVLKGTPIAESDQDITDGNNNQSMRVFDVRHIPKLDPCPISRDIHRVKARRKFKRSGDRPNPSSASLFRPAESSMDEDNNMSPSRESSLSHLSEETPPFAGDSREVESLGRCKMYQACSDELKAPTDEDENGEIELDLTLSCIPLRRISTHPPRSPDPIKRFSGYPA